MADREALLEQAIILAARAHSGQTDKAGEPYVLHALRVMLRMKDEQERIAAVLHDVVEDCGYTVGDIASQFGPDVAYAVDALSRRPREPYEAFIERCKASSIARRVKLADLIDNMDLARLNGEPTAEDARRQRRYAEARAALEEE